MRRGIVSALLIALLATNALSASTQGEKPPPRLAPQTDHARAAPHLPGPDMREALRIRQDPRRNRLWVLTLDDVRVYELASRRLIRRIVIPPWSVARDACVPDLALDRTGAAYVSGNAHPVIWRIDPRGFEITEQEIRLRGREGWAIGFGVLHFAADGTLFAVTATANSLWKVDTARGNADLIAVFQPPLGTCAMPAPAVSG